jgi:hypothetical protein
MHGDSSSGASAESNKGSAARTRGAGMRFCVHVGRRVPLSAVMRLFASFRPLLRRKTRLRLARALVGVLAFAMIVANTAAVAMPFRAADPAGAHAVATADHGDAHCAAGASAKSHVQAPHGQGCPCCDGKSCACAPVCGAVTLPAALIVSIVVSTRLSTALPSRSYATISVPLLRPPIV